MSFYYHGVSRKCNSIDSWMLTCLDNFLSGDATLPSQGESNMEVAKYIIGLFVYCFVILPSQGEAKMTSTDFYFWMCCEFASLQILAIAILASQGEAKMTSIDFGLSICLSIFVSECHFTFTG